MSTYERLKEHLEQWHMQRYVRGVGPLPTWYERNDEALRWLCQQLDEQGKWFRG
jgi:hypothetical protein